MMPTVWPFVAGAIVGAFLVPLLIAWQRKRAVGQQVYEDGPQAHAVKQGTPTMGGLAFAAAAAVGLGMALNVGNALLFFLAIGAALIGSVDDALKIFARRSLGLRARWKFGMLTILAIAYLWMLQDGA